MGGGAIGQPPVNFIRQHHHVGIPQHGGNRLEMLLPHHTAGRVVGIGQDEQLGLGGQGRPQSLGRQAESVLRFGHDRDSRAARHHGQGLVADEARLGDEHLVPGADQGAQAQIDGFAAPDGDEHLGCGLIRHPDMPHRVTRDRLPQPEQPCIGRIPGLPLFQ